MLLRTDPFRDLNRRFTDAGLDRTGQPAPIPVHAYRQGDTFVCRLDLPGVDLGSIDLSVERNVLTIRAERRRPAGAEDIEELLAETRYGAFARQLILGDTLDADHLTASYDAGVLTVRIPVSEPAKPRRIPVHTGSTAETRQQQEAASPHQAT